MCSGVGVSVAPAEICEINDAVMCQNCTALQSGFSERRAGWVNLAE